MTDDSQNQTLQEEADELVEEMATEMFSDPRIEIDRQDARGEMAFMEIVAKQLVKIRREVREGDDDG